MKLTDFRTLRQRQRIHNRARDIPRLKKPARVINRTFEPANFFLHRSGSAAQHDAQHTNASVRFNSQRISDRFERVLARGVRTDVWMRSFADRRIDEGNRSVTNHEKW